MRVYFKKIIPHRKKHHRCAVCQAVFLAYSSVRLCCSPECSTLWERMSAKKDSRVRRNGVEREPINKFAVFARDGWHCSYCRVSTPRELSGSYLPNAPELDHIVPISKGGAHLYSNVCLSCRYCNQKKGNKLDFVPQKVFCEAV